jgi:hypothetical protein
VLPGRPPTGRVGIASASQTSGTSIRPRNTQAQNTAARTIRQTTKIQGRTISGGSAWREHQRLVRGSFSPPGGLACARPCGDPPFVSEGREHHSSASAAATSASIAGSACRSGSVGAAAPCTITICSPGARRIMPPCAAATSSISSSALMACTAGMLFAASRICSSRWMLRARAVVRSTVRPDFGPVFPPGGLVCGLPGVLPVADYSPVPWL